MTICKYYYLPPSFAVDSNSIVHREAFITPLLLVVLVYVLSVYVVSGRVIAWSSVEGGVRHSSSDVTGDY
jgi:hypothetical protein